MRSVVWLTLTVCLQFAVGHAPHSHAYYSTAIRVQVPLRWHPHYTNRPGFVSASGALPLPNLKVVERFCVMLVRVFQLNATLFHVHGRNS